MFLTSRCSFRILRSGGIGGAHPVDGHSWDISADLLELARTPVAVICAGAKSILDIPRTLEILETLGVPVIGYGCDTFPGFYLRTTGETLSARVDDPTEAARLVAAHWGLGGGGVVIAQPVAPDVALVPGEFASALIRAEDAARAAGIRG